MRSFHILSLTAASATMLLGACAHANAAASNICPFKADHVVLESPNPNDRDAPFGVPPGTGDMGGIAPQTWDLSNAGARKIEVLCYPTAKDSGMVKKPVPAGSTSCTFDQATGAVTCIK